MTTLALDHKQNIDALATELNESTVLSWLWAFLFGPIWALFIGSPKWAVIMFLLALVTLGFGILAFPFFAYLAHRDAAQRKALELYKLERN